jgi:hypothetical protein
MFREKDGKSYHMGFIDHKHGNISTVPVDNIHHTTMKEGVTGRFMRKRGLI